MYVLGRIAPIVGVLFGVFGVGVLGMAIAYGSADLFWVAFMGLVCSFWFIVILKGIVDDRY